MQIYEELLIALRQIIRAIDLHSKQLNRDVGLTGPQLIILQRVGASPGIFPKKIAEQVNLSQGTVTTILDRLESRSLITRVRSESDRRSWKISLSEAGEKLLQQAPTPLQQDFLDRFNSLQPWEQTQILSSVQRLAVMMNAEGLDAAPILEIGAIKADSSAI